MKTQNTCSLVVATRNLFCLYCQSNFKQSTEYNHFTICSTFSPLPQSWELVVCFFYYCDISSILNNEKCFTQDYNLQQQIILPTPLIKGDDNFLFTLYPPSPTHPTTPTIPKPTTTPHPTFFSLLPLSQGTHNSVDQLSTAPPRRREKSEERWNCRYMWRELLVQEFM